MTPTCHLELDPSVSSLPQDDKGEGFLQNDKKLGLIQKVIR